MNRVERASHELVRFFLSVFFFEAHAVGMESGTSMGASTEELKVEGKRARGVEGRCGQLPFAILTIGLLKWVWLKIKQEGLRRCWSMFPRTRVPFWYRFFEPQPSV